MGSTDITYEQWDESLLEYPLEARKLDDITGRCKYNQRTRPATLSDKTPHGPLEERNDVLVYRTPPLSESIEIVGLISVSVFGSSGAPDTDFTAKLLVEYPPNPDFPNGFALNLCDSICRARYRGYRNEPDFVEPGTVCEFEIKHIQQQTLSSQDRDFE